MDEWQRAIVVHWSSRQVGWEALRGVATVDGLGPHILLLMRYWLCNRRNNHIDVSKTYFEINDGENWMIEQKDNRLGAESKHIGNREISVLFLIYVLF
jgi:hypothetical protein